MYNIIKAMAIRELGNFFKGLVEVTELREIEEIMKFNYRLFTREGVVKGEGYISQYGIIYIWDNDNCEYIKITR